MDEPHDRGCVDVGGAAGSPEPEFPEGVREGEEFVGTFCRGKEISFSEVQFLELGIQNDPTLS